MLSQFNPIRAGCFKSIAQDWKPGEKMPAHNSKALEMMKSLKRLHTGQKQAKKAVR
jgi:hypothetical protein